MTFPPGLKAQLFLSINSGDANEVRAAKAAIEDYYTELAEAERIPAVRSRMAQLAYWWKNMSEAAIRAATAGGELVKAVPDHAARQAVRANACRACGSTDLTPLFSLGEQYVSNFVEESEIYSGHRCEIALSLCNGCTMAQADYTAPQDFLYTRHYWYVSSTTQTMRDALQDVVDSAIRVAGLDNGDTVLDIGSNDGHLLNCYPQRRMLRVGFEPATNLVPQGTHQNGNLLTVNEFWSAKSYFHHVGKKAKIVTACGMLYDSTDPSTFVEDVSKVLAPGGVFVAQLMCARQMLEVCDVGNLAHEHLLYFTLKSLHEMFGRYGLGIFDVEQNSVNGGSYRIYAARVNDDRADHLFQNADAWKRVKAADRAEREMGLDTPAPYREFYARACELRDKAKSYIEHAVSEGARVWVLGSSTKGNVILQFYSLDNKLIGGASERSPIKWGKYTVGTGIKIYSEEEARAANPTHFLALPYAFRRELLAREEAWRLGGGKMIFPLPDLEIV